MCEKFLRLDPLFVQLCEVEVGHVLEVGHEAGVGHVLGVEHEAEVGHVLEV